MKTNNPKSSNKRFDKIVKHIVEKSSPSSNPIAVQDEEEAIDQAGKKRKLKSVDLPDEAFK